eukprot:3073468-Rhodomonas_salina.1
MRRPISSVSLSSAIALCASAGDAYSTIAHPFERPDASVMMSACVTTMSPLKPRMWSLRSCHAASHDRLPT